MDDFNRKWKKEVSRFKSDSKIKRCFHYDEDSCNGKIKSAHSLQKNGVLSILEHEVNKNKVVYSFLHRKLKGFLDFYEFEPLGKKECSTFHGFCDYHDSTLFSPIENQIVDIDNDEHCFLLCYRAFAKEYHAKIEVNKGFKTNEVYNRPEAKIMQEESIKGNELAIRDMNIIKDKLNLELSNQNYLALEYLTYSVPYIVPIACASSITPEYSYKGEVLNQSMEEDVIYENVMVTVLPTKYGTHVVLGCFPEDFKSVQYLDELQELPIYKLENAITSILIGEIENTFISPIMWDRMNAKTKSTLMNELTLTGNPFHLNNKFFKSKLNLLSRRYAIKKEI